MCIIKYFGRRGTYTSWKSVAKTVSAGHLYIFMLHDELTKNHKDDTESADEQMHVFQKGLVRAQK